MKFSIEDETKTCISEFDVKMLMLGDFSYIVACSQALLNSIQLTALLGMLNLTS